MKIRTDIKDIINQYANVSIGIEDPQRENFLRFQRNVEYVLGLKVDIREYNKLRGVLALNHLCEQKSKMDCIFHITEYMPPTSSRIYIALHLGCYEEIVNYLIKKEGQVCIPVTERVYLEETKHYNVNLRQRGLTSSRLVFVNIETNTGLRQMIRYVQDGYCLLCYIDGNSGIGGMARKDSKLERINFFNTTIHVRRGIEYLSRILNREVTPIISYIEDINYQPHIDLMPPVKITPESSLTNRLWHVFAHAIWKYYWQWEAWLYIDEFIDEGTYKTFQHHGYVLNANRFLPVVKSGVCYYYDRRNNKLVKVGRKLFKLLNNLGKSAINTHDELTRYIPKETLLDDLLTMKLIIKI